MLPRLPLVEDVRDFWAFSKAGRKLAFLHLDYESNVKEYELIDGIIDYSQPKKYESEYLMVAEPATPYYTQTEINKCKVEKMRFPKLPSPFGEGAGVRLDKSKIIYNSFITIKNIPEAAYQYVVNGKSAIEWVMERYQITTHKESGIVNNPNDWAREARNPRYILDLLLSVISLSEQTVEIVRNLPDVRFE